METLNGKRCQTKGGDMDYNRIPGPGDVWGPVNYNCGDPREPEEPYLCLDCGNVSAWDDTCPFCGSENLKELTRAEAQNLEERHESMF